MRVNLFSEQEVRIWLRLIDSGPDLGVEEMDVDLEIGNWPTWYEIEKDQVGVEHIIGPESWPDGPVGRWSRWALHHGIAPRQPFCISIPFPDYYTCETEYGTEHDVSFTWELITIEKWSTKRITKEWACWLEDAKDFIKHRDEERAKLEKRRLENTSKMGIGFQVYFAPGQSSYDDMEMPRGVRYCLGSIEGSQQGYVYWSPLVYGESHEGDNNKAMNELFENVVKAGIKLSRKQFDKLPRY